MKKLSLEELPSKAKEIRRDIIQMLAEAGSGHPGGSLSSADIVTALYFHLMNHNPSQPKSPDRDRLILSKGHAAPVIYAALAHAGYFPRELLRTLRKLDSPLQGHPDVRRLPGLEASTGSLGQGLSIGIGCALARRLDNRPYYTYVIMSDGETNEGQTWEAASAAAHHRVDHLIAILDYNKFQLDDAVHKICDMEPMVGKWQDFNWHVQEIDGHNFQQIIAAVREAQEVRGKPCIIVAHTVKGKGISFMENNNHFHGVAPTKEEAEQALAELA